MKKTISLFSSILLALFLAACGEDANEISGPGDDVEQTEDPIDLAEGNAGEKEDKADESPSDYENEGDKDEGSDSSAEKAKNQDDMKKMMEELNFTEIEVEISYGKDKEYEIEIEHHSNRDIEAEVEDEVNDVRIDDDLEAFNHIYPDVKKLNIDKNTSKEDAIDQVLKAFGLDDNYEEFEVELTLNDGTELLFED